MRLLLNYMATALSLLKLCNTSFISVFQGQQLKMVEDEVYSRLVEQINLHSEGVISEVKKATTALRADPKELHDFSKYALLVHSRSQINTD